MDIVQAGWTFNRDGETNNIIVSNLDGSGAYLTNTEDTIEGSLFYRMLKDQLIKAGEKF